VGLPGAGRDSAHRRLDERHALLLRAGRRNTACGMAHLLGPGPGYGYEPVPELKLDRVTVTVTTPPVRHCRSVPNCRFALSPSARLVRVAQHHPPRCPRRSCASRRTARSSSPAELPAVERTACMPTSSGRRPVQEAGHGAGGLPAGGLQVRLRRHNVSASRSLAWVRRGPFDRTKAIRVRQSSGSRVRHIHFRQRSVRSRSNHARTPSQRNSPTPPYCRKPLSTAAGFHDANHLHPR
jgi:hypothetical protein